MERLLVMMILMVMAMSGVSSIAVIMAAVEGFGSSPGNVTVTLDWEDLPPEFKAILPAESTEDIDTEDTEETEDTTLDTDYTEAHTKKPVVLQVGNINAPPDMVWEISALFNQDSYLVVGDNAYCTDVLGTAKISHGLALGGSCQNPEGRTDMILTPWERDAGNLIIVGGPAVNPAATEFGGYLGITYEYVSRQSFTISCEGRSIYLDLRDYPQEDICIIYLGELSSRNVMLVWGYGWRGTYAGSLFMGDPVNWLDYRGAHLLLLRWKDKNLDGLVQLSEITVENYI
jgi:hypothetical protein